MYTHAVGGETCGGGRTHLQTQRSQDRLAPAGIAFPPAQGFIGIEGVTAYLCLGPMRKASTGDPWRCLCIAWLAVDMQEALGWLPPPYLVPALY